MKVTLEELSADALWCRTERHLWLWERDTVDAGGGSFIRHSTCERCGATRTKTVSLRSFTVVSSRIRYPDRYLLVGGRPVMADVYAEQFARSLPMGAPS